MSSNHSAIPRSYNRGLSPPLAIKLLRKEQEMLDQDLYVTQAREINFNARVLVATNHCGPACQRLGIVNIFRPRAERTRQEKPKIKSHLTYYPGRSNTSALTASTTPFFLSSPGESYRTSTRRGLPASGTIATPSA